MSEIEIPELLGGEPVHDMTSLVYQMLGPALTAGDGGEWLLLKMVDAMCHPFKVVWDLVLDSPQRPGWWDAFNPDALPGQVLPWLPWMCQFTGDYYDKSVNGIDVLASNPDQINRDKVARLRNWHRGTVEVLERTISERLPGGASVAVLERQRDSINHLSIDILCGNTISQPGLAMIYQAVIASIPAGDTFDIDVFTGPSYASITASLPVDTYDSLQGTYPTFNAIPATLEAPYTGPLPPPAVGNVDVTTWYDIETFEGTWQHVESYGSWAGLESAGTT